MSMITEVLATKIIESYTSPLANIINFIPGLNKKAEEKRRKQNDEIIQILDKINSLGIPIETFDQYIANDMDRKLKQRYGRIFLLLTFLFTCMSYAIIVLNSLLSWNIPAIAITGLIIEIPIQFISILFIIAKNLFPQKVLK